MPVKAPEGISSSDVPIKGGTLEELIEKLTPPSAPDEKYTYIFMITAPSFVKSARLLNLLIDRYKNRPSSMSKQVFRDVRFRVLNVLASWLEFYIIDPQAIDEPLKEFLSYLSQDHPPAAIALKERLKIAQHRVGTDYVYDRVKPGTSCPSTVRPSKRGEDMTLLDIDPVEMARQLTLMEYTLYCRVTPLECLRKAWSEKKHNIAFNVRAVIDSTNDITEWVSYTIVSQEEPKMKSKMLRQFILIGQALLEYHNYNTLMSIIAAIHSSSIYRLPQTWEHISDKYREILESLEEVMNSDHNYARYRALIKSHDPPCIPFLGRYLTDLTFIDDGNPDFLDDAKTVVNFEKQSMTAGVIKEIQTFQNIPFALKDVPEIQNFIKKGLQEQKKIALDKYEMSVSSEPKERTHDTVARHMYESGFMD